MGKKIFNCITGCGFSWKAGDHGGHDCIGNLVENIKQLEKDEKKAFWFAAENTANVHGNNIQKSWEDYINNKRV